MENGIIHCNNQWSGTNNMVNVLIWSLQSPTWVPFRNLGAQLPGFVFLEKKKVK